MDILSEIGKLFKHEPVRTPEKNRWQKLLEKPDNADTDKSGEKQGTIALKVLVDDRKGPDDGFYVISLPWKKMESGDFNFDHLKPDDTNWYLEFGNVKLKKDRVIPGIPTWIEEHASWYNARGEKLGWGDLLPENFRQIQSSLQKGEAFVVLSKSEHSDFRRSEKSLSHYLEYIIFPEAIFMVVDTKERSHLIGNLEIIFSHNAPIDYMIDASYIPDLLPSFQEQKK